MIRYLFSFLFITSMWFAAIAQEKITPPTFEKNEGLILRWNNVPSLDSTVSLVTAIISTNDKVWIVYDNNNSPSVSELANQLSLFGANLSNVSFIASATENPWLGDYGPIAGYYYDNNSFNRHFADASYGNNLMPHSDFLPLTLASEFGFDYSSLPLQIDVSNLQLDGIGRAYVSDKVLTDNSQLTKEQIIEILYTNLSLNYVTILPSIAESGGERGEISRLIKFIDPESLLVTSFPENTPYYEESEALADSLSNIFNDTGRKFKVYRVQAAPVDNNQYATTMDGKIGSYTSTLVFNNKVIIPQFGKEQDTEALNLIHQIYKGYEIHSIPAAHLADLNGSLNRMAIFVPQEEIFRMRHSKITEAQQFQEEMWVNVFAQTWLGVDSIQVFYRIHPETEFTSLNSIGCCGGNSGYLSGYSATDTISYYIKAYYGNISQTLPIAAPSATYTFWFDAFAAMKNQLSQNQIEIFPNPVSDKINLKYSPDEIRLSSWGLFNSHGIRIMHSNISNTKEIEISSSVSNGIYFLVIQTEKGNQIVKRVIVQR